MAAYTLDLSYDAPYGSTTQFLNAMNLLFNIYSNNYASSTDTYTVKGLDGNLNGVDIYHSGLYQNKTLLQKYLCHYLKAAASRSDTIASLGQLGSETGPLVSLLKIVDIPTQIALARSTSFFKPKVIAASSANILQALGVEAFTIVAATIASATTSGGFSYLTYANQFTQTVPFNPVKILLNSYNISSGTPQALVSTVASLTTTQISNLGADISPFLGPISLDNFSTAQIGAISPLALTASNLMLTKASGETLFSLLTNVQLSGLPASVIGGFSVAQIASLSSSVNTTDFLPGIGGTSVILGKGNLVALTSASQISATLGGGWIWGGNNQTADTRILDFTNDGATASFWVVTYDGTYTKEVSVQLTQDASGILSKITAARYAHGNQTNLSFSSRSGIVWNSAPLATNISLPGYGVASLSIKEVGFPLTPDQMAGLNAVQLGALSAAQVGALDAAQIGALSSSQVQAINGAYFSAAQLGQIDAQGNLVLASQLQKSPDLIKFSEALLPALKTRELGISKAQISDDQVMVAYADRTGNIEEIIFNPLTWSIDRGQDEGDPIDEYLEAAGWSKKSMGGGGGGGGDTNAPPTPTPAPEPISSPISISIPQPNPHKITFEDLRAAYPDQIYRWKLQLSTNLELQSLLRTLVAEQSSQLSSGQIYALDTLVGLLSIDAIRGLSNSGICGLSALNLSMLTMGSNNALLIDCLTQYQIQNLPVTTITGLTRTAVQSKVLTSGRSVLASLYFNQLGAISNYVLGGLTLDNLMQTSILRPNGISISVLQALPWKQITRLSSAVIRALTPSQLALTNLQEALYSATFTTQSVLQGLNSNQITELNAMNIRSLSGAQLMLANASGHTVLQDLSSAQFALLNNTQFAGLSPAMIAGIPGGNFNNFQLSALDNEGNPIWSNLTNTQIQQLSPGALYATLTDGVITGGPLSDPNNRYLQNMTVTQIRAISVFLLRSMTDGQLNTAHWGGNLVWHEMIMNPAQASSLPTTYQWRGLSSSQVTSIFNYLVRTGNIANLDPAIFSTIQIASLVNGILGMSEPNRSTFITGMTNSQLAQLNPNAVNGLLTSSITTAQILLNAGAPDSLTVEQFQALITGNTNIGQMNANIFGRSLSALALLSLTADEIAQLTYQQWVAVMNNPSIAQVVYNAGNGNGYWTAPQLQAVSDVAVSRMTQDQYLGFANGLSMFSQAQQNAMSTNSYLLEIMVTGQTNGWSQEHRRDIENRHGMMGILLGAGGGGESSTVKSVNKKYQITNWKTANAAAVYALLTNPLANGTNIIDGEELDGLLLNPSLPVAFTELAIHRNRQGLVNILSSKTMMARLDGDNFAALTLAINNTIMDVPSSQRSQFVILRENQVSALIAAPLGGASSLYYLARYAPNSLPNEVLTQAMITRLINADDGATALSGIVRYASHTLRDGPLTQENITAIIAADDGATALSDIARYGYGIIFDGALMQENVTRLIATANGIAALASIAEYAPNTLSNGSLTQENITAIIAADDGATALSGIVRYASHALSNGSLTQENITRFIATGNGMAALANIAQYAPNALSNGSLTQENITRFIATAHGIATLASIAQYAPNALSNGSLTQENITRLIATANGIATLASIAQYAPNALSNGSLTQENITRLIATANGIDTLALIAQYVPNALSNGSLTQENITRLIAAPATFIDRNGSGTLASIARYAPDALLNGKLTQDNVTALLSAWVGNATALADIARYAPNTLPNGRLTQENVKALIASRRGHIGLGDIARYAPNTLPNEVLMHDDVTALNADKEGRDALQNLYDYAPLSFAVNPFTPEQVALYHTTAEGVAFILNSPILSTAANIAIIESHPDLLNQSVRLLVLTGISTVLNNGDLEKLLTPASNKFLLYSPDLGRSRSDLNAVGQAWISNRILELTAADLLTYVQNNGDWLTPSDLPAQGAAIYGGILSEGITGVGINTLAGTETGRFLLNQIPAETLSGIILNTTSAQKAFFNNITIANVANLMNGGAIFLNRLPQLYVISLFSRQEALTVFNTALENIGTDQLAALLNGRLIEYVDAISYGAYNQISVIALAGFTPAQANNIHTNFWREVNHSQLGAMFTSPTLGANFFNLNFAGTHISVDNLQAISAISLANAFAGMSTESPSTAAVHTSLMRDWVNLSLEQQNALLATNAFSNEYLIEGILAGLTPIQANLLPPDFWRGATARQLADMFTSPTLGANFFDLNFSGIHISQENLNAIPPNVLVLALSPLPAINQTAMNSTMAANWLQLTGSQRSALENAHIPGFSIPPHKISEEDGDLSLAGDPLTINQQIISGISLLAGQATSAGNPALGASAQDDLVEVRNLVITGYRGEVATGTSWAKGSAITVSAAGFTDAKMTQLNFVLGQYATITGLSFQTVAAGGQINLGFSNLSTATTGAVGYTRTQSIGGVTQSAHILLQDATEVLLDADGIYAGTQASFTQVLLHEMGHALGLADNNVSGSIANYYLGANNRSLSAADITALQTIYDTSGESTSVNSNSPAELMNTKGLDQLVQAMASANSSVGAVTTSTGTFTSNPGAANPLTLVSNAGY